METDSNAASASTASASTTRRINLYERLGQFLQSSTTSMSPALVSGLDQMRDGRLNKGMAFSIEERQSLGIHGLLPPRVKTQDEQVAHVLANMLRFNDDLDKYTYLMGLQERNEKLFYKVLSENVEVSMPLVYTPTVGLACQKYGLIFEKPRGLFISIHDAGHVYDVLKNWPEQDVRAIVVTDGERILWLGDLGVYGMGIPVGKLALYTALAGIKPHQCLPVTLDCGTNNESLLNDPDYIGSKQRRVTGPKYYDFIDEFMQAAVKRYGQNVLIQFENFESYNANRFLDTYRNTYCTFNDDIQVTASAALAGLYTSLRVTNTKLSDNVILFQGTGQAALGIAGLCVKAMLKEGTSLKDARSKIWFFDTKGHVLQNCPAGGNTEHGVEYMKNVAHIVELDEVVKMIKPTVLIGVAGIGGAFTEKVIKEMSSNLDRPVIFALSNPTSNAECTAEQAYIHSKGKAVFASSSPFAPVTLGIQKFYPSQGTNSYIFPGVALGVICAGMKNISDDVFIIAAKKLSDLVTEAELINGSLYPSLQSIQQWSLAIATKVMEYAYETSVASTFPEPINKTEFIKAQLYDYKYRSALPPLYSWSTN